MIDYVEVRDAALDLLGLIDTAKSIIWESQYFGAGAFELYTEATPQAIAMLKCGNFVTRVDDDGVGIIEAVEIVFNGQDGRMITASGRLAKSILERRVISCVNGNTNAPTVFSGNVEQRARGLVQDNAIACYKDKARKIPYTARNIGILTLGTLAGLTATTESRQASGENLLTYTDELLQQYGYGAKVIRSGSKLAYAVYSGKDRSIGNAAGNEPVIFSADFDNLIGSNYNLDESARRTFALVGGEGEGVERFYVECNAALSGLERREVFIDSSTAREVYEDQFTGDGVEEEYKKPNGEMATRIVGTTVFALSHPATSLRKVTVEGGDAVWAFNATTSTIRFAVAPLAGVEIIVQYIDDNEYRAQLKSEGEQELATLISVEGFSGSVDVTNSSFKFGADFQIGDIVTVQDNGINKYLNARIVAIPEVQDDDGYQINIEFEAVS